MSGSTKAGGASSGPGFQRNTYGRQVTPSLLPSIVSSGRRVVMTANRP